MNKDEYAQYLKTPHWATVRDRALAYAEQRCQLCYSSKDVQVHHRTYDRLGHERPADLTVLCKACHEKHHDRHTRGRVVLSFSKADKGRMANLPGRVAE